MPKNLNVEVYQYDELSEEAKEKARQEFHDINVEYVHWWDFTYEYWTEKLEAMGFYDIDISFSGFWNQGDGASFTGKVDIIKYIRSQKMATEYQWLLNGAEHKGWCFYITIDRSGHYVHDNSTSVSIDPRWSSDLTPDQERKLGREIDKLTSRIKHHVVELNRKIYRDLEEDYNSQTSDEVVADTIVANEYEFWPSGMQFVYG